nr:hypothetical protein [Eubacteriales bacterium]
TKYLDYARFSGRYPRDYLISASEKDGVKREKRSLQNWMSYNRKSFIAENREDLYEDGKKKRAELKTRYKLTNRPVFGRLVQTADKVKVSGQIFCKKPFQITRNMV